LLQPGDHGDADGESLDHGERQVTHEASGSEQGEADENQSGQHCHDQDAFGSELRDDRHQDDRRVLHTLPARGCRRSGKYRSGRALIDRCSYVPIAMRSEHIMPTVAGAGPIEMVHARGCGAER
jgi:hypothetical protein